jgi:hypothetical protein
MDQKAACKRELVFSLIGFAAILLLQLSASRFASGYFLTVFRPLQSFRANVTQQIPFSIGDCCYLAIGCALLLQLIRHIRAIRKGNRSIRLFICRGMRQLISIYLLLVLLWGILYEQPKLANSLQLPDLKELSNSELIAFDSLLIERLNQGHSSFHYSGLTATNTLLQYQYRQQGSEIRTWVKPSLFGNMLAYLGTQGYFNPFSGEAQVNIAEPDFMMPFLIAHEMAHQSGIAAEDDANLAAYIACLESTDKSVHYSATLNIWLYVHRRVRGIDSGKAYQLKERLNSSTLRQLSVLRQRAEKYHTLIDDFSSFLFDAYLKSEQQEAGINSYRNVAWSALAWEKRKNNMYLAPQ